MESTKGTNRQAGTLATVRTNRKITDQQITSAPNINLKIKTAQRTSQLAHDHRHLLQRRTLKKQKHHLRTRTATQRTIQRLQQQRLANPQNRNRK